MCLSVRVIAPKLMTSGWSTVSRRDDFDMFQEYSAVCCGREGGARDDQKAAGRHIPKVELVWNIYLTGCIELLLRCGFHIGAVCPRSDALL